TRSPKGERESDRASFDVGDSHDEATTRETENDVQLFVANQRHCEWGDKRYDTLGRLPLPSGERAGVRGFELVESVGLSPIFCAYHPPARIPVAGATAQSCDGAGRHYRWLAGSLSAGNPVRDRLANRRRSVDACELRAGPLRARSRFRTH